MAFCQLRASAASSVAVSCSRSAGIVDHHQGLAAERGGQQRAGLLGRHAARAQVEHRGRIELADGRAVRGLHFVGVDLQHRLGVDLGAFD